MYAKGDKTNPMAEKINGKTFVLEDNAMGIKEVKFTFDGDEGKIEYINAQGEKSFKFGFGKNVFGIFPQEGYSKETGSVSAPGHYYKCAVSADWQSNNTLYLNVQAIDDYFGRLHMFFQFMDENTITVVMKKTAEDFFNEYRGMAVGYSK